MNSMRLAKTLSFHGNALACPNGGGGEDGGGATRAPILMNLPTLGTPFADSANRR